MAEIRIIGNIERVTNVNRFKEEDIRVISSRNEINNFGTSDDYIEYFIYDVGGNLLNLNYSYTDFKSSPNVGLNPDGTIKYIEIDPIKDLQDLGYSTGEFAPQYNFLRRKISNNLQEGLFIKEISPDRTEIKVASLSFTNDILEQYTNNLIDINDLLNFSKDLNIEITYEWKNNLLLDFNTTYDITFIDTWHVYGHLKRELAYWHDHVKKYIIMHKTYDIILSPIHSNIIGFKNRILIF